MAELEAFAGNWQQQAFTPEIRKVITTTLQRGGSSEFARMYERCQEYTAATSLGQFAVIIEHTLPPFQPPAYVILGTITSIRHTVSSAPLAYYADISKRERLFVAPSIPEPADLLALPHMETLRLRTRAEQAKTPRGIGFVAVNTGTSRCTFGYADPFTGSMHVLPGYNAAHAVTRHRRNSLPS
jgi:hypothetical protein